jgi:hypothetical protein
MACSFVMVCHEKNRIGDSMIIKKEKKNQIFFEKVV